MASVLAKVFDMQRRESRCVYQMHRGGIADGDQRRDFIYVDDAISVLRWLLEATGVNGIFNVGTGRAKSFRDMIGAMFKYCRTAGEYRIYRYAGNHSRPISILYASSHRSLRVPGKTLGLRHLMLP